MQAGIGSPSRATASTPPPASSSQPAPLDEPVFAHLAEELTLAEDRKAETEQALMEDLTNWLKKEEKALEADAWMFAAPRSQLSISTSEVSSEFVSLKDRPEWADVTPVSQDDGPNPVVPIAYSSQFREVMDYFRAILALDERSERALGLTAEVISLNAGNYTVWYFRRLVLEALQGDNEKELTFIETVTEENFKNYQIWYHRRWVATKIGPGCVPGELQFTEAVLRKDAKNYHAWSHRQWVLREFGGWEPELDFCDKLLTEDVFNNSAWNQRYFVVTKSPLSGGLAAARQSEVQYCAKLIKAAPSNESPWRYLRGLFQDDKVGMVKERAVANLCTEVLTADPYCIHALSFVIDLLGLGFHPTPTTHKMLLEALEATEAGSPLELASVLCQRLEKLDAIHARYWAWRNNMFPPSLV